jgi:glycosyltransferase involved in cell wall biosynthesis
VTVVALTHGYVREHPLGGEVALHRALQALDGDRHVLTNTDSPYTVDGVRVHQIDTPDVLNIDADPEPIATQLRDLGATVVIGQNELSLPAVRAAGLAGAVSVVNVHTPPRYGASTREAIQQADHVVFNTATSADEWGRPDGFVLHPPVGPLPRKPAPGPHDAYTLLSSLRNKGVEVVLEMAKRLPDQRFIIVRSPAEPTHGLPDIEERCAGLPNVELCPRVTPDKVASTYLSQTRILLVPSRYETYGMSAIEAAGHGIPTVHVDTPHVREGIGDAAVLVPRLNVEATIDGVRLIESEYTYRSKVARARAEFIQERQTRELTAFKEHINTMENR